MRPLEHTQLGDGQRGRSRGRISVRTNRITRGTVSITSCAHSSGVIAVAACAFIRSLRLIVIHTAMGLACRGSRHCLCHELFV